MHNSAMVVAESEKLALNYKLYNQQVTNAMA